MKSFGKGAKVSPVYFKVPIKARNWTLLLVKFRMLKMLE